MNPKFSVGQNVYTAKPIRGWFDYSMSDHIPENTLGVVMEVSSDGYYLVKFKKEFGTLYVPEHELKLG